MSSLAVAPVAERVGDNADGVVHITHISHVDLAICGQDLTGCGFDYEGDLCPDCAGIYALLRIRWR